MHAKKDGTLMGQVKAITKGSPRACVNEAANEPATIRGFLGGLVLSKQAREMNDFDDMEVLEWIKAM